MQHRRPTKSIELNRRRTEKNVVYLPAISHRVRARFYISFHYWMNVVLRTYDYHTIYVVSVEVGLRYTRTIGKDGNGRTSAFIFCRIFKVLVLFCRFRRNGKIKIIHQTVGTLRRAKLLFVSPVEMHCTVYTHAFRMHERVCAIRKLILAQRHDSEEDDEDEEKVTNNK